MKAVAPFIDGAKTGHNAAYFKIIVITLEVPSNAFNYFRRDAGMSVKLFIGNLASEITTTQLQVLFSTAGEVDSCRVITDRATGLSKGFAFIEMNSVAAANAATEKFNGHLLQGKTMKVNEAKPRI